MASPAPSSAPRPALLTTLAQKHKVVAIVLLALAAAFTAVPITLAVRAATASPKAAADLQKAEEVKKAEEAKDQTPESEFNVARPSWSDALGPTFFWGLACAAACLIVGLGCLSPARGRLTEVDRMRLMLLIVGGTIGILTALLGMALPFTQSYRAIFVGGADEWRKHKLDLSLIALALLGGLVVAFASLQLARGVERENVLMRRLLYGFSTVFTTILLIAVLLVINLLPYIPSRYDPLSPLLQTTFDWTKSRLYSLSPRSRETLTHLKEPVKAYVFLDRRDPVGDEAVTLLQNCRGVTDKISWETVSSTDRKRLGELYTEYQDPKIIQDVPDERGRIESTFRPGVLLVYGDKPASSSGEAAKPPTAFLPRETLAVKTQTQDGGVKEIFQGENVLMKAIRSMSERKLVIYFAQGDGELALNSAGEPGTVGRDGLDELKAQIQHTENYDLKELKSDETTTKVPDDADIVVVAQPHAMKPAMLRALGAYMGYEYHDDGSFTEAPGGPTKGRLFVLSGVSVLNKQMVNSGLEPLLSKLGVKLGDNRILTLESRDPTMLPVVTNPGSTNPIARAFAPPDNGTTFLFIDARTVAPVTAGSSLADVLAVSPQVLVLKNLTYPAAAVAMAARANPDQAPLSDASVGVAVSRGGAAPNDAVHAAVAKNGGPCLVVFGASNWITNESLQNPSTVAADYNLFTSCLSWLGGEPDIGAGPEAGGGENKDRPQVTLNFTTEGQYWTTVLLPAAHMLLLVIAAGVGVWLVRRR